MSNNKLELTWVGKYDTKKIEPRILLLDKEKSYGERNSGNMLIHGDNLLGLRALEKDYTNRIKCICIDPPYNTGSAFEHYDDKLEHSIWLNLMCDRLKIFEKLLSKDGTIWIILDDSEVHYMKVLCDEIFGRNNFISDITWNSRKSVSNDAIISMNTNHILVYCKNIEIVRKKTKESEMFRGEIDSTKFSNPDNDPRGPWVADPFDAPNIRPNLTYEIKNPNTGNIYLPPKGRCWRTTKEKYQEALMDNRIVFGKTGKSKPQMKRFLSESETKGTVPINLWSDLDTNTNATKHSQKLFEGKSFTNPKPEDLIKRILSLATNPGDFVLDSFLGSGTTAAVAHKMSRKWIGIEMGDQCYSFCKVRLDKVINNEDIDGITKSVNWIGGGGYDFYELAPSLIEKDKFDESVINKRYNLDMLCEAVALHEGFEYNPSKEFFWKQSKGNENSFLYVTLDFIDNSILEKIYNQMTESEYLIVYCSSFDVAAENRFKRIKIKKIPEALLSKYEYGIVNYNLNIKEVYAEAENEEC